MSNIILHGGLLRLNNSQLIFKSVNIALISSPAWLEGILHIKDSPYLRLSPTKDTYIDMENVQQHNKSRFFLNVNNGIIYSAREIFSYSIHLKLNPHEKYKNIPYSEFFKYY